MQAVQTVIEAGQITRQEIIALARGQAPSTQDLETLYAKLQAATGYQEPTLTLFLDEETTDEEIIAAELYEGCEVME